MKDDAVYDALPECLFVSIPLKAQFPAHNRHSRSFSSCLSFESRRVSRSLHAAKHKKRRLRDVEFAKFDARPRFAVTRFCVVVGQLGADASEGGLRFESWGFGEPESQAAIIGTLYDGPNSVVSSHDGGHGGGGGHGEGTGGGGGRGDDGEGNRGDSSDQLKQLLAKYNAGMDSIPSDVVQAIKTGVAPVNAAENWLVYSTKPVIGALLHLSSGYRNRVLADPSITAKLIAEQGIGIPLTFLGEYNARRERFWKESDYVFCNLMVGVAVNLGLVWFLAPVLQLKPVSTGGGLKSFIENLPSYVFDNTRPFTPVQRISSYVYKGATYGVVGFLAGGIGASLTVMLLQIAQARNPSSAAATKPTPILQTALGWGGFLALSSNTRYQIVNGIEGMIYPMFRKTPLIPIVATWLLRLTNTFVGVSHWIYLSRLFGIQPPSDEDENASKR